MNQSDDGDKPPISMDFAESENWTCTRVRGVEKWDEIDPSERCGCGSIAEYTLRIDMINNGDEQQLDVCTRCLAKYTNGFDRSNIYRSQRDREFPDKYA